MKFLTCQTDLIENQCPDPVWVDLSFLVPTVEEFTAALPSLITILAVAWGFKVLIRQIFNRR